MMLALFAAVLAAALASVLLIALARAYVARAEAAWPAEGRYIDADGARLHVREAGRDGAPRVLLIHGASANLRELWGPLAPELTRDHRVIAFDRPGYGHSTRPKAGAEKLALQAAMAARVLEATGAGPAILVGHSLGAGVALRVAIDRPDLVAGLVLVAPASHPYPGNNAWWARLAIAPVLGDVFCAVLIPWLGPKLGQAGIASNFAPAMAPESYFADAGVGLLFRPAAFQASARDVCATKAEFAAQAPAYGAIAAPAVIVTADKDKIVSPKRHARALAEELPMAELVIAPGAGHMPHRIRPDLVLAAIRRAGAMAAARTTG